MKNVFDKWFVQRHGKRQAGFMKEQTDSGLRDIIAKGQRAAIDLQYREIWDAQLESALYAWQEHANLSLEK